MFCRSSLNTLPLLRYVLLKSISLVSAALQVIVGSPFWLPSRITGKAFEQETLIGRLLSPTSMAPSSLKPSVCYNLPAVSPNLLRLTGVFLS